MLPIGIDLLTMAGLLVLAFIVNYLAKKFILKIVEGLAHRSGSEWDDVLVGRKFFRRLSHIAPAVVIYIMADLAFSQPQVVFVLQRAALLYILFITILVIDSFLNSLVDIYNTVDESQKIPVKSISQVVKIILYILISIVMVSLVIGKSPAFFIGGIGAMTAVLMLIFKDPILGFAAGIQLSANKMVRLGDWVEMPKYGADGDVIDISLTTVKVQNWDKTIITIPTFALVSDGVKNWRGMSESGGRRIKRPVYIDMSSIKFCDDEMIDRFKKIEYLSDYIKVRKKEISDYNEKKKMDDTVLVNGRRMTNVGIFRAYLVSYLKNHPSISSDMTFLVRQLAPGPSGLPLEIYVFSTDQVWANYEAIQADIFDHVLAAIPEFDLRVFQNPTGADFREYAGSANS